MFRVRLLRASTYCGRRPRANPPETHRETRAMAGPAQPGGHVETGDTRRLTGMLVTFTWRPEGEYFPVREGKNFIGSGDVSSEAVHRSCDIQVPQDNTMSSEHALILCRQGDYEILDQNSSNGTFLGGQMLKSNQGADLAGPAHHRRVELPTLFLRESIEPGLIEDGDSHRADIRYEYLLGRRRCFRVRAGEPRDGYRRRGARLTPDRARNGHRVGHLHVDGRPRAGCADRPHGGSHPSRWGAGDARKLSPIRARPLAWRSREPRQRGWSRARRGWFDGPALSPLAGLPKPPEMPVTRSRHRLAERSASWSLAPWPSWRVPSSSFAARGCCCL